MSRWNSNYDWWICLNNTATHLTLHINLICFDQTPSPTCCYLCPFIYHPTLLTASLTKAICIISGLACHCHNQYFYVESEKFALPPPAVWWDVPHTHASSCLLLKDRKNIDFVSSAVISLICLRWWWLMMLSLNVLLIHFPGVSGHFFPRLAWKASFVTPGPLWCRSACDRPLVFWCNDAHTCVQRDTGSSLASIMKQFLAACANILPR